MWLSSLWRLWDSVWWNTPYWMKAAASFADTMGASVYNQRGDVTHWRVVRNTNMTIRGEAEAWGVAVTWSGLLADRDPASLTVAGRARLVTACL